MKNRLILSELRVLIEHYTTSKSPDPEFMRAHVISLAEAVDAWAAEGDLDDREDQDPDPIKIRA